VNLIRNLQIPLKPCVCACEKPTFIRTCYYYYYFFFLSPMLIFSLVLQQMCRYHHSRYHSSRGLWRQYFGIALSMTPPRSSQPQNTMRWKGALQANSSSCSDAIGRAPSKTLELLKCALMLCLKIWNIDIEQHRGGNMLTSCPQRRFFSFFSTVGTQTNDLLQTFTKSKQGSFFKFLVIFKCWLVCENWHKKFLKNRRFLNQKLSQILSILQNRIKSPELSWVQVEF
jgi:hypothetical protein